MSETLTPTAIVVERPPRGATQQVARTGDRLHGPVHGRARRDRREHRAALGAARPALLARQPAVGRQRLHARLRRLSAARRPRRRPARPQAPVRGRRAPVLGRLAAQRLRPVLRDADRRPRLCRASAAPSSPPPPWRSSPPRSPTPASGPRRWACGARSPPAAPPSACCMGGVLTDLASWRWVFFVNVPVGIITIGLALRYVAESRVEVEHRSFDLAGAVTVTGGLVLLVYAIVKAQSYGWGSGKTIGLLAAAVALLAPSSPSRPAARRRWCASASSASAHWPWPTPCCCWSRRGCSGCSSSPRSTSRRSSATAR